MKTLAWCMLGAAYVLLPFGLLRPIISIRDAAGGPGQTRSTVSAIEELYRNGYFLPCGLLAWFSVALPILKGFGCLYIALRGSQWISNGLHVVSKYQCVDIFTALLTVAFLSGDLIQAELLSGSVYFFGYCALSIAGAHALAEGAGTSKKSSVPWPWPDDAEAPGPGPRSPRLSSSLGRLASQPSLRSIVDAALGLAGDWSVCTHIGAQVAGIFIMAQYPLFSVSASAGGAPLQWEAWTLPQTLWRLLILSRTSAEGGSTGAPSLPVVLAAYIAATVLLLPAWHALALGFRQRQRVRSLWCWSMLDVFAIAVIVTVLSFRSLGFSVTPDAGLLGCALSGASLALASEQYLTNGGGSPEDCFDQLDRRPGRPFLHAPVLLAIFGAFLWQKQLGLGAGVFRQQATLDIPALNEDLGRQHEKLWRAASGQLPVFWESCRGGEQPPCEGGADGRATLYSGSVSMGFFQGKVDLLRLGDLQTLKLEGLFLKASSYPTGLDVSAFFVLRNGTFTGRVPMFGEKTIEKDNLAFELTLSAACGAASPEGSILGPWRVSGIHLLTPVHVMMLDVTSLFNEALQKHMNIFSTVSIRLESRSLSLDFLVDSWLRANSGLAPGGAIFCPSSLAARAPPPGMADLRARLANASNSAAASTPSGTFVQAPTKKRAGDRRGWRSKLGALVTEIEGDLR